MKATPVSLSDASPAGTVGSDPTTPTAALAIDHRLKGRSQCPDIKPERNGRKPLTKFFRGFGDGLYREENVDHDGQFGLEPAAIPFALAFNASTMPRGSASRIVPSAVNLG
jgi:hypothetical protein